MGAILLGTSVYALAPAAFAQAAQPAPAATAAEEVTLGEIVVTARRKAESLQEVPQTVNAVTADTLQKLNIRQFQDLQSVVPGLSLQGSTSGTQASASLRGVTFAVNTAAQPTVAFYLNDAPVQLGFIFQSMFDVGQVEVLKGPQGTTRGISAPSGAMTITTRKPDLSEFGGYADVTLTDLQGRNAQAAINVPIIRDVLGLRLAGLIDQNAFDGVTSIHSSLRPTSKTSGLRASVSFEPSDLLNADITYQHLDHDQHTFLQVSGPGAGVFTLGDTVFPASVNPPLTPKMRASAEDAPNISTTHFDVVTVQADSRLFGQHLSYVGSYSHEKTHSLQEGQLDGSSVGDVGNLLPGITIGQDLRSSQTATTQEFRVASDPGPGRFFDYTVGAYYSWTENKAPVGTPGPLLPGAFGVVPGINLAAFNPAYQIPLLINAPNTGQETSLFGSVTLHLGENTELSGGVRHIWSIYSSNISISTGDGLLNLGAIGLNGAPCSLLGATPGPNPGDCVLKTASVVSNLSTRYSSTPNIYNVSLSHHFSRNFLVYANTGTAFRPPVATPGIQGELANSTNPDLSTLTFHPAETSRAYEVGFKSTLLDGRARLNASLFRQRFNNLTLYVPNIYYLNTVSGTPSSFSFTQSVKALVQGFDVDAALQVTPEWSVSAQMSYADGKVKGSLVPCNIFNAAGNPVFNTGGLISLCPGGAASTLPLWNATFQSEYIHPVSDRVDGFLRLLATYYPENKNRAEPDFTVPNYSLVNLYLGVRGHDGAWEASIFARNAFNTQKATDISSTAADLTAVLSTSFPQLIHPSGYYQTKMTPRREVGVNVHYAFGSR